MNGKTFNSARHMQFRIVSHKAKRTMRALMLGDACAYGGHVLEQCPIMSKSRVSRQREAVTL